MKYFRYTKEINYPEGKLVIKIRFEKYQKRVDIYSDFSAVASIYAIGEVVKDDIVFPTSLEISWPSWGASSIESTQCFINGLIIATDIAANINDNVYVNEGYLYGTEIKYEE